MLILLLQETPAICYNDEVLGTWQVDLTEYNYIPNGDMFKCPLKLDSLLVKTKYITLMSPNRAIDSDGYTGTWTMNFAEELEIKIGGKGFPPVIHYYDMENDDESVEEPQEQAEEDDSVDLPSFFDWRNVNGTNYIPEPVNIDRCSAWGPVMFAHMMESRIRIASNNTQTPNISIQHIVDCNIFEQGCISNHPEDHARFAQHFGLLDDEEYGKAFYPEDFNETCLTTKYLGGNRYFVDSYQFMGGYYGAHVSINEMKREIYANGPIIANVQQTGIFGIDPYGDERKYYEYPWDTPERHFYFDAVKNEVLIIGWTALPSGASAWIVQNAFGKDWNGDGTALVAMGINAYAIESAPFVAYWRPGNAIAYGSESSETVNMLVGFSAVVLAIAMVIAILLCYEPSRNYAQVPESEA